MTNSSEIFICSQRFNLYWLLLGLMLFGATSVNGSDGEPHHTTAFIGFSGIFESIPVYSYYATDHFWNKHGEKLPTYNGFTRQAFLFYAEYAFNDWHSLTLNGGYSAVEEKLNGNSYALNDVELGWKFLWRAGPSSALTAQLIAIIPSGPPKSSVRYGQPGAQISLLYSDMFSLWKRRGWYDLEIGYRYYHNFPSDQIRANLALTYLLLPVVQFVASSQLDWGVFDGAADANRNFIVFNPNYRLWNVQVECRIGSWQHASIVFGAFKHIWGINCGIGGGFFGGAKMDF